jgi:hypothetical protein
VVVELQGVEILWPNEFYDGPLDGLASYAGRQLWFVAVGSQEGRRFSVHELTAAELEEEWRLHRLYEELVGSETCWHLGYRKPVKPANPDPERFFQIREKYVRPNYSSRPVVGYFSTNDSLPPVAWLEGDWL